MNLAEYADHICGRLGKSDAASLALCKGFVRQRWKMIWDSALWAESKALVPLAVDAGQKTLLAPPGIERVIALRWDTNKTLGPVNPEAVFDFDPELWERTGDPGRFSLLTPAVLGPTAGADGNVTLQGFNDADATAGKKVKIVGEALSGQINEYSTTVPPTAAGQVIQGFGSSDTWVISVSKEVTVGEILVVLGAAYFQILRGPETEATRCPRVRLLEIPKRTEDLLMLGKRRANLLLEDQDTPLLQNCENALLAFASADMLERMRQYSKAAAKIQEAQAQMQILHDLERGQQANQVSLIPSEEVNPGQWSRGFSGKGYW